MPSPSPPEPVTVFSRITRSWEPSLAKMPPRPVLRMTLRSMRLRDDPQATRMPPPNFASGAMFSTRQSEISLSVTPFSRVGLWPLNRMPCGPQVFDLARFRTVT